MINMGVLPTLITSHGIENGWDEGAIYRALIPTVFNTVLILRVCCGGDPGGCG